MTPIVTPKAQLQKKLCRKPRKGSRLPLLKISQRLFEAGYMTAKGNSFAATQIKRIVEK